MQDFVSCQAPTVKTWQPERIEALAKSTERYPVDFEDAWVWIGYSQKIHAKAALERNFIENIDFSRSIEKSSGGRPPECILLTADCFKQFCMQAGTEQGRAVRKYFMQCEQELKRQCLSDRFLSSLKVGKQLPEYKRTKSAIERFIAQVRSPSRQ